MIKLSNVSTWRGEEIKFWRGNNHGRRSVTVSSLPSALAVNHGNEVAAESRMRDIRVVTQDHKLTQTALIYGLIKKSFERNNK